jgi:hypothetical protein
MDMKDNNFNMDFNVDRILHNTLKGSEVPTPKLIEEIKVNGKKTYSSQGIKLINRSFRMAAAVFALFLLTGVGVFATQFLGLGSSEVAYQMGDSVLSAAFDSEDAVHINERIISDGYAFTLLSMVSGEDISETELFRINHHTYLVVAIEKVDGSPMPLPYFEDASIGFSGFHRDDGTRMFMAAPFIHGIAPAQFIFPRGGGISSNIIDGIKYMIIDVNDFMIFADHTLYLGINSGGWSVVGDAFLLDEGTGEIVVNPEFEGIGVLFTLPIDESFADSVKADEVLQELMMCPIERAKLWEEQQRDGMLRMCPVERQWLPSE